jgi:MoaA/NifB/PqqE/SkfB family radical SAM enzyme
LESGERLRVVNYAKYVVSQTIPRTISKVTNVALFKPSIFTFDITDRCQLRCLTCSKWKTPQEIQANELTTKEWKDALLAMKRWIGEFSFFFSGGEPFLRKDILEICSFAEQQNIHPKVVTNGYGFHGLAQKIVESRLESVTVSLNGATPQTHDATRGVEGAFAKSLKFIDELNSFRKIRKERTTKLFVNTILFPANYNEVVELAKWVQEKGLDGIHFQPMDPPGCFHSYPIQESDLSSLEGAGGDWYRQNLEETTNTSLSFAVDRLIEMKNEGYKIENTVEDLKRIVVYYNEPMSVRNRCPLGLNSFNIDPYGYVRFCFDMKPIGNIKDDLPQNLFNNRKALKIRRKIKNCDKTCHWAVC